MDSFTSSHEIQWQAMNLNMHGQSPLLLRYVQLASEDKPQITDK